MNVNEIVIGKMSMHLKFSATLFVFKGCIEVIRNILSILTSVTNIIKEVLNEVIKGKF